MDRCFACNRPLAAKVNNVTTADGQIVTVGADCYRMVRSAGEGGYQPPLGGPRLYLIGSQG